MLKILHTGDIHLDSPFSHLDERRAEIRRREVREAFSDAMTYARENGVDLVLIAGDVFDGEFVTRETAAWLQRELAALRCPVVIAPGNHDCRSPSSVWARTEFPENVRIFRTAETEKFSFDDLRCDVYGYAFTAPELTECPLSGRTVDDPARINLICAHGDTSSPLSRYCPITRAVLRDFGADYAALGHIHNPGAIVCRDGTVSAYCGSLEARAPDETGEHGAIVAEIEKEDGTANVRTERIRFSRRRYESLTVDVTGADTFSSVEEKLARAASDAGCGEDTLLRAELRGAVAPGLVVDTKALEESLPGLFAVRVTDATAPALSMRELENDRTVRGEFCRALLEKIESGSPRERRIATMALRCGLAAMSGEEIGGV